MLYIKKWRVRSESSGKDYIVSLCEDGTYACGCRGWTGHTPRKDCKHIDYVLYWNPEPINKENWDALQGKKAKVTATLAVFAKIQERERQFEGGR